LETHAQWRNWSFESGVQSLAEGAHWPKLRKRLRDDSEFLDVVDVHTR